MGTAVHYVFFRRYRKRKRTNHINNFTNLQKMRKKRIFFSTSIFLICCLLWSNCNKENGLLPSASSNTSLIKSTENLAAAAIIPASNSFYSTTGTHNLTDAGNATILGNKRTNPYTVDVMNEAFLKAYGYNGQLGITDYYIKLLPKDGNDLKKLDNVAYNMYDYPLEYEVVKMGEYYQDPSVPSDKPTPLYAVVKPTFAKPPVPFEIIANLHIPSDELLIQTAFTMTGNNLDEGYALRDPKATNSGETTTPRSGGGTTEPATYTINTGACGCTVSSDQRKPGGCISVVDDALPVNSTLPNGAQGHIDGCRRVKVILKDTWFTEDEAFTSDNGCFFVNKRYRGVAWMWVKFKSSRCTVRRMRGARLWEYGLAVKDYVGKIGGPNFSNIQVVYGHVTDDSDRGKLYWYAATANNALHEFDDLAACDGIGTTPQGLDILLTNNVGGAAAPMLDKLMKNPLIAASVVGIIGNVCGPMLGIPVVGPFLSGFCVAISTFAAIFAPDIVNNYGSETIKSDRVKDTFYHEYAHAAHYNGLPASEKDDFWLANIMHIIRNGGYGAETDQTSVGARRTAVIEGWGYHVGTTYTDRRYGTNHSLNSSTDAAIRNQTRHIFVLEQVRPDPIIQNGKVTIPGWIPRGVMRDLIDDNATNPAGVTDPITDRVRGFTTKQYFQVLNTSLQTPIQVRDALNSRFLPTGQSAAEVNNIFSQYRWN